MHFKQDIVETRRRLSSSQPRVTINTTWPDHTHTYQSLARVQHCWPSGHRRQCSYLWL